MVILLSCGIAISYILAGVIVFNLLEKREEAWASVIKFFFIPAYWVAKGVEVFGALGLVAILFLSLMSWNEWDKHQHEKRFRGWKWNQCNS